MSDYYQILGVDRSASAEEIKKAYKSLALQYHPDTAAHLSDEEKLKREQKFKQVSEAYAVLSDETKKQQYDTFGNQQFHQQYSAGDIFSGADFSAIFDELNIHNLGDLFSQGFGGRQRYHKSKGRDVVYALQVSFMDAFHGSKKHIRYQLDGEGPQSLTVKIPAGIRDGTKLKVSQKGERSDRGVRGDLYVKVSIEGQGDYERRGDDLMMTHKISLSTALLGGKIHIVTCDGKKQIHLSSPANLEAKLRLKGLGFYKLGSSDDRGDLYCELSVDLPQSLSEEQTQVAHTLKAVGL